MMHFDLNSRMPRLLLAAVAFAASSVHAETQCIRQGNEEIILLDDAQEYCPNQIVPVDPALGWKWAYSDERHGCWRSDGTIVYVTLDANPTTIILAGLIEPLSACKKFDDQLNEKTWEIFSETCENLDIDSEVATKYCRKALALAERYGEDDPRLLRSVEVLSARSEDPTEAERLLERSKAIRQRLSLADPTSQMESLIGIGRIRQQQGQIDAAEASYREAIRLGRLHLGDDNLDVVAWTLFLGKMYFDLGRYDRAEEQLLAALAGAERDRPIYWQMAHQIAASTARILADLYTTQGKNGDAERFREISSKHREAAQRPPNHDFTPFTDNVEGS